MSKMVSALIIGIVIVCGAPIGAKQVQQTKVEDRNIYHDAKARDLVTYLYELDDIAHYFVQGESEFKQNNLKPTQHKIVELKAELFSNYNLLTLTVSERNALSNILNKWEKADWKDISDDHNKIATIIRMYVDDVPTTHEGNTYKVKTTVKNISW